MINLISLFLFIHICILFCLNFDVNKLGLGFQAIMVFGRCSFSYVLLRRFHFKRERFVTTCRCSLDLEAVDWILYITARIEALRRSIGTKKLSGKQQNSKALPAYASEDPKGAEGARAKLVSEKRKREGQRAKRQEVQRGTPRRERPKAGSTQSGGDTAMRGARMQRMQKRKGMQARSRAQAKWQSEMGKRKGKAECGAKRTSRSQAPAVSGKVFKKPFGN